MDWGKFGVQMSTPHVSSIDGSPNSAPTPGEALPHYMPLPPVVSMAVPLQSDVVGVGVKEAPAAGGSSMVAMASNSQWHALATQLAHGAAAMCLGAAGKHSQAARQEAATKLIGNHENLLKDVCNPSSSKNIIGVPLTQLELVRVDSAYAHHVDEGLREVARRLLGQSEQQPLHSAPEAIEARAACARYLNFRIQSHPDMKPGRTPDMSPGACAAMMAVLVEVGSTLWEPLHSLLGSMPTAAPKATGAAARFEAAARAEAASRLIGNHFKLLLDVCNPLATTNVDNIELGLTQLELVRVHPSYTAHVDEGLREAARRLLGRGEPRPLNPRPEAIEARACCARYLHFRIQSHGQQKPGRRPDMSPQAAKAMKAVLAEVGGTLWEPLYEMQSHKGVKASSTGVLATHAASARGEAASKVLGNHFHLLCDIANPSKHLNIENVPLTQTELTRVEATDAGFVDEALREAVRRLLGWGSPLSLSDTPNALEARATAAMYLEIRVQALPKEKPGRTPDMSPAAKAALVGVMHELAQSSHGHGFGGHGAGHGGAGADALSLADDLEHLATQLRLSGEVTPRQMTSLKAHMQRMGSVGGGGGDEKKSSMCAIM